MLPGARLRQVLLVLVALALPCCGKGVPRYQMRTASEWVTLLWDPDARVRSAANEALAKMGEAAPTEVLAALEAALTTKPMSPTASPFSVALDLDEGRRLGLAGARLGPSDVTDAVSGASEVLKSRAFAAGVVPTSFKGLRDGSLDIVVGHALTRVGAKRVQELFCVRGALGLRILAPDPAAGPVTAAARPVVYDGKVPYADFLANEVKRHLAAWSEKRHPSPTDPRWRAVPRVRGASTPAEFVLVEEPASDAEALDERMVHEAKASRDADGAEILRLSIRPATQEALANFSKANRGHTMAVVLDGVLFATVPVPVTTGATLDLALWPAGSATPSLDASGLAVVLAGGRLPWPLKPIPIDPSYGTDPPADNVISRAFTTLEARSIPTLERIASSAPLAWSRASAKWALDQIKAQAEAPGR